MTSGSGSSPSVKKINEERSFPADFNFIKGGSKGILRDTVYPFVLPPPADLKWNGDGKEGEGIGTVKKIPGIVQKMQRRQCVDRINACDILCSLENENSYRNSNNIDNNQKYWSSC